MFVRTTRLDLFIAALALVAGGACSGSSGCAGCGITGPLPGGSLPATQTIEGGAQIRVTQAGFAKLTAILPGAINSALGAGFCIPKGSEVVGYCGSVQGSCNPGCDVTVGLNSLSTTVTNNDELDVHIDAHGSVSIPFTASIFGSCTMTASIDHLVADADIGFGIDATTGELTVQADNVNNLTFNGVNFSGCGVLGEVVNDVASLVTDVINSGLGQFVVGLLTPVINDFLQDLLPNPLGIEGEMDVGALLASVSPGTTAELETRIVPGGYVSLNNGGMSLGVITGLNSDSDPSTRGPGLESEPALCVPPIPVTDYGAAPYSLPLSSRGTFQLADAGAFAGTMDPNADLAMGISKTTLNLAGHHAVTSGALCLSVGTSFISELNVGTIGILVPSLADLDSTGKAPLLLVTRPQRELTFDVGDNTTASPALTIGVSHMEVDFYAFLYERYVRAFTMDISLNVGVNLDFEQQSGQPATIKPSLTGISASSVTITVLNSEFVKETPADLDAVLPTVFSLVTPLLGNLPDITVPSFAGFSLNNLSIQKVTTTQDDFLALYASLGASSSFAALAKTDPFAAAGLAKIDGPQPREAVAASTGTARLVSVNTPTPSLVISALKKTGGALPKVAFDVDTTDSLGRAIEWSWNINGGLWRPYTANAALEISDPAFAWQGKYEIGLKSRVVGDYRTVHYNTPVPVIIDSVAPTADTANETLEDGVLSVPIHDIVSEGNLQFAWGLAGQDKPLTEWVAGETATMNAADSALLSSKTLTLFVRDEAGNVSMHLVVSPFATASSSGCAVAGGTPTSGGLLLIGLVGAVLAFPRRRRLLRSTAGRVAIGAASWVGLSTLLSIVPGCSCSKTEAAQACESASDCPTCGSGDLPFCVQGTCECSPDVPIGRVGPYSAVAAGSDGTAWVSAYSETYGDLCVAQASGGRIGDSAWEWVDGVPAVTPEVPGSMIRGGITDAGPDVGMYTSIQVAADGTPMVSYFDVDNASLKFAAKVNGAWAIHTVDLGTGSVASPGDSVVGMYTSLSLRGDDSRPGIAYLAHVNDSTGLHAEVRFAAAQVPVPMSAADWQFWTVDTGAVPAAGSDDPYPLPGGLGLFVNVTRDPSNQAPVVVYYDRALGELKMSKLDPASGQFVTPVVLTSTADNAGWTPSATVDSAGVTHVAYVDTTKNDLQIVDDQDVGSGSGSALAPTTIDDGYRIVGQTVDGLPKPTFDFVGDNAKLLGTSTGYYVSYQDATTQELLLAHEGSDGTWTHTSIAGATDPWPGAYGFFASGAVAFDGSLVLSSWVIDQPNDENWVEVFKTAAVVQ